MGNNHIVELLKYSSPYSILVVDDKDNLIELHCPFTVIVRVTFDSIEKGKMLAVNKVLLTEELKIVYQIGNTKYHYCHFDIVV